MCLDLSPIFIPSKPSSHPCELIAIAIIESELNTGSLAVLLSSSTICSFVNSV